MTSTLVVGPARASRSRYAASLLDAHPHVTLLSVHAADDPDTLRGHGVPEHWQVLETHDLTRALLGARNPVIVDDLPAWVARTLDERDLWQDRDQARETIDGLAEEACLGLSALPFETVAISYEVAPDGTPRGRLLADLVERVNARVSASSTFVHEVRVGRVLDLTDVPLAPEL